MVDVTTGLAFLTGLGLPEILLWVLTFAVVFGILSKLKIFSRAPSALISIVVGFLVLLAVPAALITVIASMSTGMLVVSIGFIVILALIEFAMAYPFREFKDKDGKKFEQQVHPFAKHGTIVAIALVIVTALIFWISGGAALIGFGALPTIGLGTWLLIVVGAAVLWMLSEAK
jgi:uncharacterized membrane protein